MELITAPWPWYVGGPLFGLVVYLLLLLLGRPFGVSSLVFVLGILLGAAVASRFLADVPVQLLPEHYTGIDGALRLLLGGVLVGFGTRYADGCTSGHTMGLARFRWPSLVATISFFIGGLLMVHFILPLVS